MVKKICNIVSTILLVIVLVLVGTLVAPKIFGIEPKAVLSGSMEPTYHVGSLVYVSKVSPETIQVDDPITFRLGEGDTIVTHRVIEVDKENQCFYTKGDNNSTPDGGSVPYSHLIGKVVFSIPLLGYLAVYMSTKTGIYVIAAMVVLLIFLTFLPGIFEDKKSKDGGGKDEKNDKK